MNLEMLNRALVWKWRLGSDKNDLSKVVLKSKYRSLVKLRQGSWNQV